VYVTAEGDLTPCCNCPDARDENLGNLLEKPFATLWNGRRYRSFRTRLRTGVPEICRQCPDY
jgi:radical SAM protein with 4Fe4S-binding SPASM domain